MCLMSQKIGLDLDYFHNTHSWTLNNNIIEGFSGNAVGVTLPHNGQVSINGGMFNNSGIDILISPPSETIDNGNVGFGVGMLSVQPTKSEILLEGPITFLNPNNNIVLDAQIIYDEVGQKGFPLLDDTKGDSEYFLNPQEIILDFGPFANQRAYYNEQDANHTLLYQAFLETPVVSKRDPSECIDIDFQDKTNSQLSTVYNTSYLGVITPTSAIQHPMIVGGKVDSLPISNIDLYEEIDCFRLYPNPTSDYFKIESDFNSSLVTICSIDGRIQKELFLHNNYEEIDITQLPKGLYFIKIYSLNNDDFCSQKIIKI